MELVVEQEGRCVEELALGTGRVLTCRGAVVGGDKRE